MDLPMVVLNIETFFIQVGNSAYLAVFYLVTLGLAWVPPEPDLPQPSLGIARDIKLLLPLENKIIFDLLSWSVTTEYTSVV